MNTGNIDKHRFVVLSELSRAIPRILYRQYNRSYELSVHSQTLPSVQFFWFLH